MIASPRQRANGASCVGSVSAGFSHAVLPAARRDVEGRGLFMYRERPQDHSKNKLKQNCWKSYAVPSADFFLAIFSASAAASRSLRCCGVRPDCKRAVSSRPPLAGSITGDKGSDVQLSSPSFFELSPFLAALACARARSAGTHMSASGTDMSASSGTGTDGRKARVVLGRHASSSDHLFRAGSPCTGTCSKEQGVSFTYARDVVGACECKVGMRSCRSHLVILRFT